MAGKGGRKEYFLLKINNTPNFHTYHAEGDTQALGVVLEVAVNWHLAGQIQGSHLAWPVEAMRVEYKFHSDYLLVLEESEPLAVRPFVAVLVAVADLEKMLEVQRTCESLEKHQDLCKGIILHFNDGLLTLFNITVF